LRKNLQLSHRLRLHQLITKTLRYLKSKWLRPRPRPRPKLKLKHKPRLKLKLKHRPKLRLRLLQRRKAKDPPRKS
jgi:hypothetical protein